MSSLAHTNEKSPTMFLPFGRLKVIVRTNTSSGAPDRIVMEGFAIGKKIKKVFFYGQEKRIAF